MIKILIADDHQMFVDGVCSFLEKYPDIEVVATANNGEEVLAILEEKSVDIAVLDIKMPKMDGIETCKAIKDNYSETEVLIVSMFNTKEFILKLMKIGASGYILKEKTEKELVYALMKIQDGKPHFGLEVMTVATTPTPPVEKKADLSETEVEVMCHLANGNTAAETGKLLNRSMHTVNTHRKNIFAKTGVDNIVKLTRYAIRHGYIQP